MIGRLNHLAIVVPDLAAAAANYSETLGATVTDPIELPDHGHRSSSRDFFCASWQIPLHGRRRGLTCPDTCFEARIYNCV